MSCEILRGVNCDRHAAGSWLNDTILRNRYVAIEAYAELSGRCAATGHALAIIFHSSVQSRHRRDLRYEGELAGQIVVDAAGDEPSGHCSVRDPATYKSGGL